MTKLFKCPLCGSYYGANALRVHMWKSHKFHMENISKQIGVKGFFIEDTDKIIEELRLRKTLYATNANETKRFFQ